jgi:GT2 family glycosyltransferase
MYFPGAQVYHLEAATTSRYPLVKMRHFHRSPLYYFRKRGKGKAVIALKIGFSLELVVKFLIRLVQLSWLRSPNARARLQAYPVVIGEIWRF